VLRTLTVLPDGTYDALVVDVDAHDGAVTLELTILAGDHKGDVVAVRADDIGRDELDLLGLPATLTVADGAPAVTIDDA